MEVFFEVDGYMWYKVRGEGEKGRKGGSFVRISQNKENKLTMSYIKIDRQIWK